MTPSKCPGSRTSANVFAGNTEVIRTGRFTYAVCPVCQQWQKTTEAGNLFRHKAMTAAEAASQ